jgi:hypothetical protein
MGGLSALCHAVLQEADEHATLEEILSIQLTRQKLEQWHNEVGG